MLRNGPSRPSALLWPLLLVAAFAGSVPGALPAVAAAAISPAPPSEPLLAHLVDVNSDGRSGVAVTTLTSRVQRVVVPEVGSGVSLSGPQLSPDGSTVAFIETVAATSTAPVTRTLQLVPADGSAGPTTVQGLLDPLDPAWSPDGTSLIVSEGPQGADPDRPLVLVPAAGGATTPVPGAAGREPSFSRTGDRLVYVSPAGTLSVIAVTGGSPVDLGLMGTGPVWSPVQDIIAFSAGDRLSLTNAPVGSTPATGVDDVVPTRLGSSPAIGLFDDVVHPAWSNDGRTLYLQVDHRTSAGGAVTHSEIDAVLVRDGHGDSLRRVRASATGSYASPSFRGAAPAAVVAGPASVYTAVAPQRILNTLTGLRAPKAKVAGAATLDLQVTGTFTPPTGAVVTVPADATAVVLNVTAVNATLPTDVRVYPTPADGSVPPVSNLNVQPRQTTPNLVTVAVGLGGKVRLRNTAGATDLLADLSGYFGVQSAAGSLFTPTGPSRILHTGAGNVGALDAPVAAMRTLDLSVIGSLPVRGGGTVTVPSDASAVVMNVTAFGATAATDIRVYPTPADGSVPPVSNLNVPRAGVTVANLVVVKVGDGGKVRFRNTAGSTDLAADLAGFYGPVGGRTGAEFIPVRPERLLSTVSGVGRTGYDHSRLGAGAVTDSQVAGARGIPSGAVAMTLNVTGVGATTATDLRAYPSDYPNPPGIPPTVSTVNLQPSQTRANLAVVRVGAEIAGEPAVRVRNTTGTTGLILDVSGYYLSS